MRGNCLCLPSGVIFQLTLNWYSLLQINNQTLRICGGDLNRYKLESLQPLKKNSNVRPEITKLYRIWSFMVGVFKWVNSSTRMSPEIYWNNNVIFCLVRVPNCIQETAWVMHRMGWAMGTRSGPNDNSPLNSRKMKGVTLDVKGGKAVSGLTRWLERTGCGVPLQNPTEPERGDKFLKKWTFFGCIVVLETAAPSPGIPSALRKGPEANWGQKVDTLWVHSSLWK